MKDRNCKRPLLVSTAVAAISVTALAGTAPAMAQAQGAPGAQAEGQVGAPTSPLDSAVQQQNQIVVTGSRIVRRDLEANSPLVTVGQDQFENRSAVTVEDTLNDLPQFNPAGSGALSSDAGTAFTGADQAPGAATLDLRGLGANRTLVLVNGRRAQPVNAQLIVDVNTIPASAIANVEVITGGAAAVYGADAISGVVNFILRNDFEGFEVSGQAGMAEVGDAENYQASALFGANTGDGRGNAMVGVSYSKRGEAYQRNRDFYTSGWNDPNTQTGGGAGIPLNVAVLGGLNYGVNYDGTLFRTDDAANPAAPFTGPLHSLENGAGYKLNPANPGTGQQSLGFIDPEAYISIPLERYTIFGSGHYDLTDNITAFVEGNFTHSSAFAQSFAGSASNIWALQVPYNSANDDPDSPTFGANQANFYPVSSPLADRLNARSRPAGPSDPGYIAPTPSNPNPTQPTISLANTPWTLGRVLTFLDRLTIETESDIFQVVGGLRGEFGFKDWTWEVYGSHGNTSIVARQPQGAISYAYLQQLISGTTATGTRSATINGPWSQNWSSQATFNPSTCTTGIPLFTANGSPPQPQGDNLEGVVVSEDCKNYATLELNNVTTLEQNIVEATMQGGLFQNWAGEVRFAAGATYRDANFAYAPDTGNSGEQPGTGVVNQIALPKPTQGDISVKEAYGELLFPVLADVPLVERLELELGARYSDYSLSGGIWTFKALGDWEVTDWLRFRGGYQRANRAPNIFELYAPVAGGLGLSSDACLNIANSTPEFGNVPTNPNRVNVQTACNELMVRDGGFDYRTLAEDPTAVDQNPSLYPTGLDQTRMSNFRWTLGYNLAFPFSIALQEGNTDLDSEKAQTITAGAVIRSPISSPLLDRLTITVDYYSIDLKGTIAAPSGTEIYTQCFNPQYNPAMASAAGSLSGVELLAGNPYCALINRYPFDAAGVRGAVGSGTDRTYQAPFLNKGGTKTSGIDVTVNWTADFDDLGLDMIPGALNFYASANFLLEFAEAAFAGAEYVDYKGTLENESYDYKLFGTLTYIDDWGSIGLRGRYLPEIDPSYANPLAFPTDDYTQFDLFGRYQVTDTFELRAGVDNVFDVDPPIVGATPTNAAGGSTIQVYDTMGRSYYFGLRWRL
jgi:outer membrane receptor protein involved in Fe transport